MAAVKKPERGKTERTPAGETPAAGLPYGWPYLRWPVPLAAYRPPTWWPSWPPALPYATAAASKWQLRRLKAQAKYLRSALEDVEQCIAELEAEGQQEA